MRVPVIYATILLLILLRCDCLDLLLSSSLIRINLPTRMTTVSWKLGEMKIVEPTHAKRIKLQALTKKITSIMHSNASVFPVLLGQGQYWNPAILRMPSFFQNHYLVIARSDTEGMHHKLVFCEAIWTSQEGMRCRNALQFLNLPPSASRLCSLRKTRGFSDFPGMHDPRLMWSGGGELVLLGGTQSKSRCFALSAITLSKYLCPSVIRTMDLHSPYGIGPVSTFYSLSEVSQPGKIEELEKNWIFIFSSQEGMFIQYELNPRKRKFSKHLGGGYVSSHALEVALNCAATEKDQLGVWHQATNALRMVLCFRKDMNCEHQFVQFAFVHRKVTNKLGLMDGGRYERYSVLWDASYPFTVLAFSELPLWFPQELRDDEANLQTPRNVFYYSVSISWDTKFPGDAGFLDDDIVLSLGKGDKGTFAVRTKAFEVLRNLRPCTKGT